MKCACTVCGKHIEYEPAAAGVEIACPHCGKATRLAVYSAAPPPISQPHVAQVAPARSSSPWIIILVIALGIFLVVPIVGLLAAIAIPNFIKARQSSQTAACVSNLKAIDSAKATWALDHKKLATDVPTDADLFGSAAYIREKPTCPAGGIYSIEAVGEKPTCTIPRHAL